MASAGLHADGDMAQQLLMAISGAAAAMVRGSLAILVYDYVRRI